MRVASLVGTRPQFLKLSPLCDYINDNKPFDHIVIHSGQHYDDNMSGDIFRDLNIPAPAKHIKRIDGSNSINFGHMLDEISSFITEFNIDVLIVFGDCDTTLAGAMAARRLNIQVVHVEAGMRSFNMKMPEEVNRVLTDNISDILLCPDQNAINRLSSEGIDKNVHLVGNLQVELINNLLDKVVKHEHLNNFSLLTIHRDYNTTKSHIEYFFNELADIDIDFIFPAHPRTQQVIADNKIKIPENIYMKEPFSYIDTLDQLYNCTYVVTDSGGLQLESWYLGKKCLVLRTETEWCDAIKSNNSMLYSHKTSRVGDCINELIQKPVVDCYNLPTNTSELIVNSIT